MLNFLSALGMIVAFMSQGLQATLIFGKFCFVQSTFLAGIFHCVGASTCALHVATNCLY